MAMSRYEIRNEYSLADPEVYRGADKDDPEALLEGVAMAGLVGVLRQLGDLAEFAAELFHDLHEEVMATAARGHGLMIRVQQLEIEVPTIEKAFLTKSDHSSHFYNAGVDWHPNLQMDKNLVTRGDLPRFVMDSYEECRGPPRLFLLDKFDVAGAGSCLKRYTDPSFFKVETSGMTSTDGQRERKVRKAKKKGPRWKNGEISEVLPSSHAKLHQLFLEEPVENGVGKPARHAKLKRRLNGFPFDSRTGKSYMEKIVKSPSPDRKMLDEVPVVSSMMLLTNGHDESGLEVLDVRSVSPDRQILERKRNPSPPQREIGVLNPSTYKPEEVSLDDNICDASNSYLSIKTDDIPSTLDSIKTDDIPSTLDNMSCERDMAVDIENKTEGSLTGYQSDDIASEIDNYVDAPSTIESEMDTDSEFRAKSDFTSSSIKSHPLISEANEDHFHSQSIDSQSTGESTKSYEGNTSSRKEISSFLSADSSSTSVENPQTESFSAKRISSDGSLEISVIARSSHHKAAREDFPVDNHPKFKVSDGSSTGKDAINDHESDFEQLALNLFSNDKLPTSAHSDSENARHDIFRGSNSEVMDHTSNDKEAKTKPFVDLQCSPSVSDFKLMLEDDSSLSSSGEHLMDKPNGGSASSVTTISRNVFHNADTSVALSAELLPEDDSGLEDLNLVENITSTPRMSDIHSQEYENPEIISTEIPVPCKLDDEVLELPENTNTDHDGAHTMSPVSKEENPINEVDHEFSNVHSDASHQFSCFNEDCLVKELVETPLTDAQTVDFEDHHSDSSTGDCIISENLFVSHTQRSRDWSGPGDDAYVTDDVIPEEDITVNETPELGTSESCEVVSLLVKGDDVNSDDFEVLESSCSTSVYPEDPIGTSDSVAKDGITVCTIAPEPEITEISCSDYVESLNKEHVLVEESNFRTDQPGIADTASFTPKVSDSADRDTVNVPASHGISVEEHIPCLEDSATNELPNDQNSVSGSSTTSGVLEDDKDFLSGSYREPVLLEEVGEREAAASDMDTIFCSTPKNDHPKSEISQVVPISYLDSGVEQGLDFVKCSQVESNLEQSGKDVDQKSFWQNGVGDELSDAHFLHIDHSTEETISQEKVDAPPSGPDQRLVGPEERSSELSAPMPIDHQQMPDHDDDDDDHQKGEDGSASTFSAVSFPPPVPEFPEPRNYDIDVSGYHRDPLSSIFPPRNNFSEANGINREELPPLPPLPPVQWRMGKLLQASSCTTERDTVKHKELPSQETFPSITLTDDVTSSPEEVNHSLIRVAAPGTPSKEEEVEHRLHNSSGLEANSASRTIHLPPRESLEQGISPPTITSSNDVTSSPEEMNQSPIQVAAAEAASKEDKVEYVSSSLKANAVHQSVDLPPKTEKEQGLLDMVSSENELKLPAEEDGAANGSRPVKLPRPHNPLIDDVAALDKSKLRKVTERVRPQTEKVDERDSLLEQIRAKSFNLKPAVPSRPNTLGPKTNLKVAAILEKANAIRQAFAGSDDDDDSWSDL